MAVLACAAVAGPAPSAVAQCQYEVTAIITPDDAEACWPLPASNTFARGMNSNGEIVGYYTPCALGNERAFFWSKEAGFVTLPTPTGVSQAYAIDINDHGIIIGRHVISGVGGKGFVYDPKTGVFTYLEPVHPGVVATELTVASSINNSNIITGSRVISEPGVDPPIRNAVLWYLDTGEVVDLGVGAGPSSAALDGNDGTDAAGWSGTSATAANAKALLWTGGAIIDLGVLPDATTAHADAVNQQLEIVGESRAPSTVFRGFYWYKGTMIELKPPPPFDRFRPEDISNTGQVAGSFLPPSSDHAAIWQNDNFYQLKSLVVNSPIGLSMNTAGSVNELGEVRVSGTLNGATVGALLSPANVPVGDFDFDCSVNVADLIFLLSDWGQPMSKADLNGNGTVGVPDLLILLSNWSP